jgi:hypothetical protein
MNIDPNLEVANSVLETKAIGSASDIAAELSLPDGKPIEELLDDQEKEEQDTKTT